jgi:hypothetical protein
MAYGIVAGQLISVQINTPEEEKPGWLPSPHKFRAMTFEEYVREGKHPEDAKRLAEREQRRVAALFSDATLDEAEKIADELPAEAPAAPAPTPAENSAALTELRAIIVAKTKELEDLKQSFDTKWKAAVAENDSLKKKLAATAKKEAPAAEPAA